jgi:antitoxin Phd
MEQAARQAAASNLYKSAFSLYASCMSTIDVSEARQQLSAVIDRAETEAVTLVRYGRPAAVLVSPARYEELLSAVEDAEDIAAFDEAMAEEGSNIPWAQVKADLGWA